MRTRDLVEFGPQVVFRHPLVRSVVYQSTPLSQQRRIHRALAAAGDAGQHPDRVAWHLGMAARGLDDAVAARLEQAAERARECGGTRPRRRSRPVRLSCQWTSACAPRGCSQQPKRSSPPAHSIGRRAAGSGPGGSHHPGPATAVPPCRRPARWRPLGPDPPTKQLTADLLTCSSGEACLLPSHLEAGHGRADRGLRRHQLYPATPASPSRWPWDSDAASLTYLSSVARRTPPDAKSLSRPVPRRSLSAAREFSRR